MTGLAAAAVAVPPLIPAAGQAASASAAARPAQPASPARALTSGSYRYWSFWEQSGKSGEWSYATQGPSVLRPGDGDVIGFRFALSEDSKDAAKPRGRTDFARACDGTKAASGRKRIALRIDFGTSAHAPRGEHPPRPRTACARVSDDATAADALASVAQPLRYDSAALLCAIDGYPQRGCGERVADEEKGSDGTGGGRNEDDGTRGRNGAEAEAGAGGPDGSSGGGLGPVAGVAAGAGAVAVLAFAAVRRSRRGHRDDRGPRP
ncbi:hypothetical protein HCC61_03165 [Streptomyces sp. HNM0575]|nr:hypothetical protein [Streptomyces sp. HNM0575]